MKWRSAVEWLVVAGMGIALGLAVAWAERVFAIPKIVVQAAWLTLILVAMGFAGWAAWRYYRAVRDENDWD